MIFWAFGQDVAAAWRAQKDKGRPKPVRALCAFGGGVQRFLMVEMGAVGMTFLLAAIAAQISGNVLRRPQRDRLLRHRRSVPVLFDRHPAAAARQGKVNITSLSRNWREGRAKGCRRFAAALFRGDLTKRPSRATIWDGK